MDLSAELAERIERVLRRLAENFEFENLPGNFERFYELEEETFVTGLKKAKRDLSLREQDDWEDYFVRNKEEILRLAHEKEETLRETNALICKLYGLSEKEKQLVAADYVG